MRVSILIPCYNAERWVKAAVESALAQTCGDHEVVVVDDGSTDRSLDVIRSFGSAIRWETGPNRGGNAARNRLLELARGEWVQYLDADDYLSPTKIERQLALAAPDVDVMYSPVTFEHLSDDAAPRYEVPPIAEPRDPWRLLIRWVLPQTGGALWRKSAVEAVGGWKVGQPCCQEHELYLRLLKAGRQFMYCDDAGAFYRQWSTQTVCRKDPLLTFQKRLEVVAGANDHLNSTGQMTVARQDAINWTRLECARSIYPMNREAAIEVAAEVERSGGRPELPEERAFPRSYRMAYRLLGFEAAERIASSTRKIRQMVAR